MTMTMIEGLPPSAEQVARARALRKASVLIATHAEAGPTRADVLEKLALLIADLEGMPARECRSCGNPFGVGRDELAFWFHDAGTLEWVDGDQATFIHAGALKTPMSGAQLAFADAREAARRASALGGRIVGSLDDMLAEGGAGQ